MRSADSTQFSIDVETKNRLDRFKANHKARIIEQYKLSRRLVTNDDAIRCLLDDIEQAERMAKRVMKKTK